MNTPPATLTVLISGSGSNLAAIINAIAHKRLNARIERVIADRDCAGKQHAFSADIPFTLIDRHLPPNEFAEALNHAISEQTNLIVLAGFLSIIPERLIARFPKKIINLHPSLLPKYGGMGMYGKKVHQAVIKAKEQESGCTIHYVDQGIDTGEIIAQARVPVYLQDTPETLQQRIQKQEHELLIHTLTTLLHPKAV